MVHLKPFQVKLTKPWRHHIAIDRTRLKDQRCVTESLFPEVIPMPIPLIPLITALSAGGSLVPHAAGGMIVSAAAGGYVTGTYLGTAAIASIITVATTTVTLSAAVLTGAASTIVGSAGIFGTTIGASGLTGFLMSAGILQSTPIVLPIAVAGGALGFIYLSFILFKLKWKLRTLKESKEEQFTTIKKKEVKFTKIEAKIIEVLVKLLYEKKIDV